MLSNMKLRIPTHSFFFRRRWLVLLSGLVLLAAGCATMSTPKIGLGGIDDNQPRVGH